MPNITYSILEINVLSWKVKIYAEYDLRNMNEFSNRIKEFIYKSAIFSMESLAIMIMDEFGKEVSEIEIMNKNGLGTKIVKT